MPTFFAVGAGCAKSDYPEPVDSSGVATSDLVATLSVTDAGLGKRTATALLLLGGPASPPNELHYEARSHIRLVGADQLSVHVGQTAHTMNLVQEAGTDDHYFHYEASFDTTDGDDFTFDLTRGEQHVVSTVKLMKPFQIVEPAPAAEVALNEPFKFRWDTPGSAPSAGKVDGACVSSQFFALLPWGPADGTYSVPLTARRGQTPPCDATAGLTFEATGQIAPELAQIDIAQSSSVKASQVRTVPVRIVANR